MNLKDFGKLLAAISVAMVPLTAWPQSYPMKPIRVVVPYPPGGVDVAVRLIMPIVEKELGQPWVIEYKPGAGGLIGHEYVARSEPDGYTILATVANPWINLPALRKQTPYDPIKDFTPITMAYEGVQLVVANPKFPANSFTELVAYARRNPGKVAFATSGIGSAQHLDAESIMRLAGIEMIHAPFQGFGPMIPAMVGGQVPLGFITYQVARGLVAGGKLKIIAVTKTPNKKVDPPPGVQLVPELLTGFDGMPVWMGYGAPAGLPRPMVNQLHRAIVKALADPKIEAVFAADKNAVIGNTPEEMARRIKAEYGAVKKAIKEAGIPPQG